jgi:hypothetical protein
VSAYLVQPEQLGAVWGECAPWIQAAIERNQGDENLTDVLIAIARGIYLLWHSPGLYATVAQIQKFPRQTVGLILYCGGRDLEDMKGAFEDAKGWCRQNGVDVIRTWGRMGWAKVLDMTPVGVILQCEV